MQILNLVNSEISEIKYEISHFPDGQQQVKIPNLKWRSEDITIKARMNNFKDLELIICTVKSLKNLEIRNIHLFVPYFLGSRSDRKFEQGGNNYLKQVICPIINNLKFESVTVIDPHSDVLEACLDNFRKIENIDLIKFSLAEIYKAPAPRMIFLKDADYPCILISPDAGANKKVFKVAEQIGYNGDIITCNKSRDERGKLTRTQVPYKYDLYQDKDMIIIDDICDGGATFINIAKDLKENTSRRPFKGKLYLIVTHGIFSKGFEELSKYFDGIYCTNSYKDLEQEDFVKSKYYLEDKVKQLNVFV